MLWKFPDFEELTERQWKEGWIEAFLREQSGEQTSEQWWVAILRCMPMGDFPAVIRETLWDKQFEYETSARYALNEEVIKRGYPRPKNPIFTEEMTDQ